MPTADEMRATMMRYLESVTARDAEAVVALFADNVSVEDPVGGDSGTHVTGRAAVLTFFRKGFERSKPTPKLTGAIRTTLGNEAAMSFTLQLELDGRLHEVDVTDVITFDDQGKIARLRAFWNPDEIRAQG